MEHQPHAPWKGCSCLCSHTLPCSSKTPTGCGAGVASSHLNVSTLTTEPSKLPMISSDKPERTTLWSGSFPVLMLRRRILCSVSWGCRSPWLSDCPRVVLFLGRGWGEGWGATGCLQSLLEMGAPASSRGVSSRPSKCLMSGL